MPGRWTTPDGWHAVLDHHVVIRDGSVWLCRRCRRTWPFPSPLPDDPGPCRPRPWPVDLPKPTVRALTRACRTCGARPYWLCFNLSAVNKRRAVPHAER